MSIPTVEITQILKDALITEGYDVDDYLIQFRDWKTAWNRREYLYWFFGKDGANKAPLRNNIYVLRHVHLPPPKDSREMKIWDAAFDRDGKKSSDTALFYAGNATLNRYILLYVVTEPNGHKVQDMTTLADTTLMNLLADQAEKYLNTGKFDL